MKYIKIHAPELDALFQCEIPDHTAAKLLGPPPEGWRRTQEAQISDVPFADIVIMPRYTSEWTEADRARLEASRK